MSKNFSEVVSIFPQISVSSMYVYISFSLCFRLQICSLLHQRYQEFSSSLVQGLLKVFFPGKSGDDSEADRNLRAMKKRSSLKLLLELFYVGVTEDSGIFVNIIKDLTNVDHFKDRDATQTNLSLLASFARQGRTFLGLPQSGQELLDEVQYFFHLFLVPFLLLLVFSLPYYFYKFS